MTKPDLADKQTITRSEFYALVWQHTMRDLSKVVGCKDVRLHTLCKLWEIPRPTKAQRGKLMLGKHVKVPTLPPHPTGDPTIFRRGIDGFATSNPVRPRKPHPLKGAADARRQATIAQIEAMANAPRKFHRAIDSDVDADDHRNLVEYRLKITRWDYRYSFGINFFKDNSEPLTESSRIILRLETREPIKMAGREAWVELFFAKYLSGEQTNWHRSPTQIGGIDIRKGIRSGSIGLPQDAAAPLIEALASGRLQFVKVMTQPVDRGYEVVKDFDIRSTLDDGD